MGFAVVIGLWRRYSFLLDAKFPVREKQDCEFMKYCDNVQSLQGCRCLCLAVLCDGVRQHDDAFLHVDNDNSYHIHEGETLARR
jgi:hypothetical protein